MIVLIPTYKRTQILHWVIASVLQCDTDGIDERILILIANNHYPSKEAIEAIVARFDFVNNFECRVIHREKTLPPVESWFSAIFEMAYEDEVVFLLGDDDIMLPWGLKNRYKQIQQKQVDMLLSDCHQRIYFFQDGEKYWIECDMPRPPIEEATAVPWEYLPAKHPEASFISNHCYRNTAGLREGFKTAMFWCKAQHWVPNAVATGNLPFYMAYAITGSGGSVAALHEKSVLRGSIAAEGIYSDYADGGNTAFYCLLIYDTFANADHHRDIHEFDALRRIYLRGFISAFVSILANKNIRFRSVLKTMQHSNLSLGSFVSTDCLTNYHSVLRLLPWLRGYRLKKIAKSNALRDSNEFISGLLSS